MLRLRLRLLLLLLVLTAIPNNNNITVDAAPCLQQLGGHLNRRDLDGDSSSKTISLSSDGRVVAVGVGRPSVTLPNGFRDTLKGFVEVYAYDESTDRWMKMG